MILTKCFVQKVRFCCIIFSVVLLATIITFVAQCEIHLCGLEGAHNRRRRTCWCNYGAVIAMNAKSERSLWHVSWREGWLKRTRGVSFGVEEDSNSV